MSRRTCPACGLPYEGCPISPHLCLGDLDFSRQDAVEVETIEAPDEGRDW